MDAASFTDRKTGDLVQIETELSPDWAFVPNLLPPAWEMPDSLTDRAMEAWGCLEKLDGIGHTLPNPELLLRPLQDREAIQSSKLEGTYASAKELLLFAQNPRDPKSDKDPANAWKEVYNYREALRAANNNISTHGISQMLMRSVHGTLMSGVRGGDKTPGEFRKGQVGIGHNYRFIPPPPIRLTDLLENFVTYANTPGTRPKDRLVRPFLAHYQFETIHPFGDGNGRIGRVLLAVMIFRSCGHRLPWLYLSPFFEKNKDEYVERLFRISTNGEWTEWVEFCLRGTIEQCNDAITRCAMLRDLRERYLRRVIGKCTPRTHEIIESLFHSPTLGISELQKRLDIAYKTAKTDIGLLVDTKILAVIEGHKPTTYYAAEIFRIAYSDRPYLASESTAPSPPSSQSLSVSPD